MDAPNTQAVPTCLKCSDTFSVELTIHGLCWSHAGQTVMTHTRHTAALLAFMEAHRAVPAPAAAGEGEGALKLDGALAAGAHPDGYVLRMTDHPRWGTAQVVIPRAHEAEVCAFLRALAAGLHAMRRRDAFPTSVTATALRTSRLTAHVCIGGNSLLFVDKDGSWVEVDADHAGSLAALVTTDAAGPPAVGTRRRTIGAAGGGGDGGGAIRVTTRPDGLVIRREARGDDDDDGHRVRVHAADRPDLAAFLDAFVAERARRRAAERQACPAERFWLCVCMWIIAGFVCTSPLMRAGAPPSAAVGLARVVLVPVMAVGALYAAVAPLGYVRRAMGLSRFAILRNNQRRAAWVWGVPLGLYVAVLYVASSSFAYGG